MTTIQQIIASNEQLRQTHESITAVFTGATHGIGLETLKAFLTYIPKPKAILVSRNRLAFAPELEALRRLNPDAEISFLEAELSLMSEVDRICEVIKQRTPPSSIDLLCMSQGYAPLGPRRFNKEGLDEAMTLGVYGRVRLAGRLIHLSTLSTSARVVSILGGAKEDKLFLEDMELKDNYSVMKLRCPCITQFHNGLRSLLPRDGEHRNEVKDSQYVAAYERDHVFGHSLVQLQGYHAARSGQRTLGICCFGQDFEHGSSSIDLDGTPSASELLKEYRKDEEVRSPEEGMGTSGGVVEEGWGGCEEGLKPKLWLVGCVAKPGWQCPA